MIKQEVIIINMIMVVAFRVWEGVVRGRGKMVVL